MNAPSLQGLVQYRQGLGMLSEQLELASKGQLRLAEGGGVRVLVCREHIEQTLQPRALGGGHEARCLRAEATRAA